MAVQRRDDGIEVKFLGVFVQNTSSEKPANVENKKSMERTEIGQRNRKRITCVDPNLQVFAAQEEVELGKP